MKVSELYNAVALLGFEKDIDEEATFYPALNTALHDVKRIVPTRRNALLAHFPPDTLVADTDKVIHSNEVLFYKAEGAKAFCIEISGAGEISFKDENNSSWRMEPVPVDKAYGYRVIRAFCKSATGEFPDTLEITIKASTMCRLKAIAIYGDIMSEVADDIPSYDKYIRYNLERIIPDFAQMCTQPRWRDSNALNDYYIDGSKFFYVPRDKTGDIEICYIAKVREYTIDDANEPIELDEECIGALKLLIASYVWLDDNASRAQYYKGLYNEEIALIAAKHRDLNLVKYESVNNW